MILPFAHESHRGRRWPVVTIALVVANVLCLLAFDAAMEGATERVRSFADDVVAYRDAHPALEDTCAPVARLARPRARRGYAVLVPSIEALARDQAEYDGLCRALEESLRDVPSTRWGYVPARNDAVSLVTYQFVHAGWLHLISNLWFLWLCGCNLEDRWGRAVYLPFYLTAGIVAALAQKVAAPDSVTPIVGASGAIAGAMGAFLVLFARTRIKFAYVFFLIRWGTFTAPAAVMLPLWLVTEIFWGLMGGGAVAHWAHVGGFVYGALFALVLARSGIDAKLDAKVEQLTETSQDARILRAGHLVDAGAASDAVTILLDVAREQPRNIDAQLELLRAAKAAKSADLERRAYTRLVELYLESGAVETAGDLFVEMVGLGVHTEVPRGWTLNVAAAFAARSLFERSNAAYEAASHEGMIDVVAVRAAIAHAKVLAKLRQADRARDLLTLARESPFSSAEIDAVIDGEMQRLA